MHRNSNILKEDDMLGFCWIVDIFWKPSIWQLDAHEE